MQGAAHYNYYRDYDPDTGRYLQPDPIGLAGGLNPYLYVNANPLRFTDPNGLQAGAIPFPWLAPSAGAAGASSEGAIAACIANPAACAAVGGVGALAYGLGSLLYPHIAEPLGKAIDNICRNDEDEEEDECEQLLRIDTDTCNGITRMRGARAGAICHASATQRYAECRRGGIGNVHTPLSTWNN